MKSILALLKLTRRQWPSYAFCALLLLAATGLFLLLPQQIGAFVARLSESDSGFARVRTPMLIICTILLGQAMLSAAYTYYIAIISERIGNDFRHAFFENLLAQPMERAAARQLGGTASQFASDLAIVQAGLSDTLINVLRHGLVSVGAIVAMFLIDPKLSAITLLCVVAVAGTIAVFVALTNKAMVRVQKRRADTLSTLVESAKNVYAIQAYGRQRYWSAIFRRRLDDTYAEIVRNTTLTSLINPVALGVFVCGVFLLVGYGLEEVASARIEAAALVAILTYAALLIASISQFGMQYAKLLYAATMYDKHAGMLNHPILPEDAPASSAPRPGWGAPGCTFRHVGFRYPGSDTAALKDADFTILPGRLNLIAGPSGSGKSTIAGLMMGLIRPDTGAIAWHSQDGGELAGGAVALVPQNPFLFRGSIRDNICFGRPWIDDRAIETAARLSQIHDHIAALPDGYEHHLEEGGDNLSRGQQQRIALARALAGDPRTLLMDEATASLDAASERAIHAALTHLRGSTTIIVVAHQGEFTRNVDHTVWVEDGKAYDADVRVGERTAAGQ